MGEPGAVQVEVYDVSGRRVRSLDLGRLEKGTHAFIWDGLGMRGERVPTGVYWIQAALGGTARTKRLVLLD
jgi:flagellar hook assembly protein FlgD